MASSLFWIRALDSNETIDTIDAKDVSKGIGTASVVQKLENTAGFILVCGIADKYKIK